VQQKTTNHYLQQQPQSPRLTGLTTKMIETTVQATTDTVQGILHRLEAEMHSMKIDTFISSGGSSSSSSSGAAIAISPLLDGDGKEKDDASSASWLSTPKAMAQKAIVDKLCQTKFGQRTIPACAKKNSIARAIH
jgi:hypothetical protein